MRRVDQDLAKAAADMLPRPVTAAQRTRYRTLRVMCHSSGLAATYAYVASKSRGEKDPAPAYRMACDGIGDRLAWLGLLIGLDAHDPRQVLQRLGEMDTVEYLAASDQVTALLGWLARLADAGADAPSTVSSVETVDAG
jgi:CubicO group peptidase (beta-lactamase class C family)